MHARTLVRVTPLAADGAGPDWSTAQELAGEPTASDTPPVGATFGVLPRAAGQSGAAKKWSDAFADSLYRGATGTAGEIGHMVVDAGGRHCGCGHRGCLEAYASRTAITKTLLGEMQRGRPSVLRDLLGDGPEPGPVSAAIRSGST